MHGLDVLLTSLMSLLKTANRKTKVDSYGNGSLNLMTVSIASSMAMTIRLTALIKATTISVCGWLKVFSGEYWFDLSLVLLEKRVYPSFPNRVILVK
jgi:hypothetical protein